MRNTMKRTHEQFLKDLLLKNDKYRNGEFEVVSEYECTGCKILVRTKFGLCDVLTNSILQNSAPNIMSAIDKTDYFRNMCIARFGDDNDDLSEIDYVGNKLKIKVKCKVFNEYYYITPNDYYAGNRSKKSGRLRLEEAKRLDQDYVFERIKELHPDIKVLPNQVYKSSAEHILVKDKYGVCRVKPTHLLFGHKPTIQTAINKNEYFINQAREIHGDKYDYSLVEYKHSAIKVKIISKYGAFEQAPIKHLEGSGCPIEGRISISDYQKNNPSGWSYTSWEASAKKSKSFTGYKLYFIECWDDETGEKFYKIGRTFSSIYKRFYNKKSMPYSYKVLNIIESNDAREICELEQFHKAENKEFLYTPSKEFKGMNECFSKLKENN